MSDEVYYLPSSHPSVRLELRLADTGFAIRRNDADFVNVIPIMISKMGTSIKQRKRPFLQVSTLFFERDFIIMLMTHHSGRNARSFHRLSAGALLASVH